MKKRSTVADDIADGLHEILQFERGKVSLRSTEFRLPAPPVRYGAEQVRAVRDRLGWSQAVLARIIGVSPDSVRSWEQGLRRPSGAAARVLEFLENPDLLSHLVSERKTSDKRAGKRLPG